MSRRGVASAVAVAVALLLSACASIPTSGVVTQNNPSQAVDADPSVVFLPQSPANGADPEEIVRGFVQAATAGGDYRVAKEYLTQDFAESWQPDERVLVHIDPWTLVRTGDDQVELRVPVVARVDGTGLYTPAAQASQPLPFNLTRVGGQWRISSGPTGVILAQRVFRRIFSPTALQYWNPAYSRFVADLRWFPNRRSAQVQESRVVQALVGRQSDPLRGVTVSAFPDDARLIGAVEDRDGLRTVDISAEGQQPDERTTDRMQQQIAGTLQVPASSIRLSVNGVSAPTAPPIAVQQPSTQNPVVLADGRFGTLSGSGLSTDAVLGRGIVATKPAAVTVSSRQRLAAVLTTGGVVAIVDPRRTTIIDRRPGLIAPTLDQQGWTYSVPASRPDALTATSATGRTVAIPTGLGGSSVLAIEASTDGTRLLVLIVDSTGPSAYVASIQRDSDGTPIGLSSARYVVPLAENGAIDATWVDQTTVAVLTGGPSVQNVVVQQLGGPSTLLGAVSDARAVVGATSRTDLRVLLQNGDLVQQPTNVWQSEFTDTPGVSVLAVQR